MPINDERLLTTLGQMKTLIADDPVAAIRSQRFIQQLHDFCAQELDAFIADHRRLRVQKECNVFGARFPKDVDIGVLDEVNGPLILLGIRSQMSSVGKNLNLYVEGILGELSELRKRFPLCIMGYLYMLPTQPIKPGLEKESVPLAQAEYLFSHITRQAGQDFHAVTDVFDHFGWLVVDFASNPPTLSADWPTARHPELHLRDLFDRLVVTFKERNPFIAHLFR